MKLALKASVNSFREIFNFQNDESKGRIIALTSTLLTTVYNVFVTGIFYTGFLSMYGMSITDTGILTFVPYIANLLSIFSPKILSRFHQRKKILLGAKVIYYFLYIVVATVMPKFVTDPHERLVWFVVISSFSTGFYALFSGGFTTWLYNFYPENNDLRLRYLTMTQVFSSILSSIILICSGFITDALSHSPFQDQLILVFRYFAFFLVLVDVFCLSKAKEYPYQDTARLPFSQVFTLPFKYKKFLRCMILMFAWNYIANLNNGLWSYHLLNHMHFSYTLINFVSVLYTVTLILLSPVWNRVLRKFSWIKTLGIAVLLDVIPEFFYFNMTPERSYLFIPTAVFQHCMNVGVNLAYGNLLYINLPKENSTAHITFNTIGCNICAFLGLITGTLVSSITGDDPVYLFGMNLYSVQYTTLMRAALLFIFGLVLVCNWRSFTSDQEIARVEWRQRVRSRE